MLRFERLKSGIMTEVQSVRGQHYHSLDSVSLGSHSSKKNGCSIVYILALIIQTAIVGYFAYDFCIRQDNVDDKTLQLRKQLESFLQSLEYHDNDKVLSKQANKEIDGIIMKAVNCDPDYALAKYILKTDLSHISHRHDKFPRPFLHLAGGKALRILSPARDEIKHVDGTPMVTGWQVEGGNNCSKVDPTFDGASIRITQPGTYLVYSAVTFHTNSQDAVSIHRHVVEYTECFEDFCDGTKSLTENAYQIHSGKSKVSYQSGVYKLKRNDVLRVLVKKSPLTTFIDSNGDVEAFFGVLAL